MIEPGEPAIVICLPATKKPHVPSSMRPCDTCGRAVWVSKSALKFIDEEATRRPLCPPCGQELLDQEESPRIELLPDQRAELLAYGGPHFVEAAERIAAEFNGRRL